MKHVSISMHNVRILPMCIYIYKYKYICGYRYYIVWISPCIYIYICIFNAHAYTVAKPMTQTTANLIPAAPPKWTHQLNITLDFFHKSQTRKVLDNPHHYNLQWCRSEAANTIHPNVQQSIRFVKAEKGNVSTLCCQRLWCCSWCSNVRIFFRDIVSYDHILYRHI